VGKSATANLDQSGDITKPPVDNPILSSTPSPAKALHEISASLTGKTDIRDSATRTLYRIDANKRASWPTDEGLISNSSLVVPTAAIIRNHKPNNLRPPAANYLKEFPRHFFPKPEPVPLQSGPADIRTTTKSLNLKNGEKSMLLRRKLHRQPSPIERGYWLVDISSWPAELVFDFLSDLQEHTESGRLGQSSWVNINHDDGGFPCQVELYCSCSGDELREAWYNLLVFSSRQTEKQELHWIGWDGKPVLTMPVKGVT
jgi:hypothetical protein